MKTTGIVRRVDDLGRIVIPKEVRAKFDIREGDFLEMFVEDEMICFKKYYTNYADQLYRISNSIRENIMNYNLSRNYSDSEINDIFENLNKLKDISKILKEKSV